MKKTKCVTIFSVLTLILLKPKVISLCHQHRIRPVSTSLHSDQAPLLADKLKVLIIASLKMIMGSSKNEKQIIPIKASLALYWWQSLITFGSSKVKG